MRTVWAVYREVMEKRWEIFLLWMVWLSPKEFEKPKLTAFFEILCLVNFQCHVLVKLAIASEPNSCKPSATKLMHDSESFIIEAIPKVNRMKATGLIAFNILDGV